MKKKCKLERARGGGDKGITSPIQSKKNLMAPKGKHVQFSTTQSMATEKLLENPNDIEVETKDVMSKEVARELKAP